MEAGYRGSGGETTATARGGGGYLTPPKERGRERRDQGAGSRSGGARAVSPGAEPAVHGAAWQDRSEGLSGGRGTGGHCADDESGGSGGGGGWRIGGRSRGTRTSALPLEALHKSEGVFVTPKKISGSGLGGGERRLGASPSGHEPVRIAPMMQRRSSSIDEDDIGNGNRTGNGNGNDHTRGGGRSSFDDDLAESALARAADHCGGGGGGGGGGKGGSGDGRSAGKGLGTVGQWAASAAAEKGAAELVAIGYDEWKEACTAEGKIYYYNRRTRVPRWTLPPTATYLPDPERPAGYRIFALATAAVTVKSGNNNSKAGGKNRVSEKGGDGSGDSSRGAVEALLDVGGGETTASTAGRRASVEAEAVAVGGGEGSTTAGDLSPSRRDCAGYKGRSLAFEGSRGGKNDESSQAVLMLSTATLTPAATERSGGTLSPFPSFPSCASSATTGGHLTSPSTAGGAANEAGASSANVVRKSGATTPGRQRFVVHKSGLWAPSSLSAAATLTGAAEPPPEAATVLPTATEMLVGGSGIGGGGGGGASATDEDGGRAVTGPGPTAMSQAGGGENTLPTAHKGAASPAAVVTDLIGGAAGSRVESSSVDSASTAAPGLSAAEAVCPTHIPGGADMASPEIRPSGFRPTAALDNVNPATAAAYDARGVASPSTWDGAAVGGPESEPQALLALTASPVGVTRGGTKTVSVDEGSETPAVAASTVTARAARAAAGCTSEGPGSAALVTSPAAEPWRGPGSQRPSLSVQTGDENQKGSCGRRHGEGEGAPSPLPRSRSRSTSRSSSPSSSSSSPTPASPLENFLHSVRVDSRGRRDAGSGRGGGGGVEEEHGVESATEETERGAGVGRDGGEFAGSTREKKRQQQQRQRQQQDEEEVVFSIGRRPGTLRRRPLGPVRRSEDLEHRLTSRLDARRLLCTENRATEVEPAPTTAEKGAALLLSPARAGGTTLTTALVGLPVNQTQPRSRLDPRAAAQAENTVRLASRGGGGGDGDAVVSGEQDRRGLPGSSVLKHRVRRQLFSENSEAKPLVFCPFCGEGVLCTGGLESHLQVCYVLDRCRGSETHKQVQAAIQAISVGIKGQRRAGGGAVSPSENASFQGSTTMLQQAPISFISEYTGTDHGSGLALAATSDIIAEQPQGSKSGGSRDVGAAEAQESEEPSLEFSRVGKEEEEEEEEGEVGAVERCEGCGRTFAPGRLRAHAKACRSVFLERRRPYDLRAMRARGTPLEFFQRSIGAPGSDGDEASASGKGRERGGAAAASKKDGDRRSLVGRSSTGQAHNRTAEEHGAGSQASPGSGGSAGAPKPARGGRPGRHNKHTSAPLPVVEGSAHCPFCSGSIPRAKLSAHLLRCKKLRGTQILRSSNAHQFGPSHAGGAVTKQSNGGSGPSKVCCPHCGRGFSPSVAPTHVSICARVENRPKGKGGVPASAHSAGAHVGAAANGCSSAGRGCGNHKVTGAVPAMKDAAASHAVVVGGGGGSGGGGAAPYGMPHANKTRIMPPFY